MSRRAGAILHLLVGLPGSGKTTYAQHRLEPAGVVRVSVDEQVFAQHGRYAVDYPEWEYPEREAPVLAELRDQVRGLLLAGRHVVLDHGLWRREDREAWKQLACTAGARWRLWYLPLSVDELRRRLAARNLLHNANALLVTDAALADFVARFEPPDGEGEGEEIVPLGQRRPPD